MSYSFLLKGGQANTVMIPVGSLNNGQSVVLRRKSSSVDSTGVVANGKATFDIPANRVVEFAGDYTVTNGGVTIQTGNIDVLQSTSNSGGSGNVDLTDYYNKTQTSSLVNGVVSAKADKTYVDNQLSTKAAAADLAAKANTADLKAIATTGNYADLTGKPNLNDFATLTALAAKVDKSYVDNQLVDKANAADVNNALSQKASSTALALKADKTYVDNSLSSKADVTALSAKADASAVYVKSEVDSKISSAGGGVPANAMVVVAHGTNAAMARPAGASSVYWLGSAQPANMTAFDLWNDGVTSPPVALVLNGVGSSGIATLTISGGDGATEYALYQGSTATGTPIKTSFPATVTGLTNGTTYTFIAQAKNSMGTVTSNTVDVTPAATATTILNRSFNGEVVTSSGGSVNNIVDPSNVFAIAYKGTGGSTNGAAILYQPAVSTTAAKTYYGYHPTAVAGTAPISNKVTIHTRSNNSTALWPRTVVGLQNLADDPAEWYAAFFSTDSGATTGKWLIQRFAGGTATTLATGSTISFPTLPVQVELVVNQQTGLCQLFLNGSTTATLSATDTTPLTGRYVAFAMRAFSTDINSSVAQSISAWTVKTL